MADLSRALSLTGSTKVCSVMRPLIGTHRSRCHSGVGKIRAQERSHGKAMTAGGPTPACRARTECHSTRSSRRKIRSAARVTYSAIPKPDSAVTLVTYLRDGEKRREIRIFLASGWCPPSIMNSEHGVQARPVGWKPARCMARSASALRMKVCQTNSERRFSAMRTLMPRSMPITSGLNQCADGLKASTKP
jgi:hypothetical protein